jgi:hypothetical protein
MSSGEMIIACKLSKLATKNGEEILRAHCKMGYNLRPKTCAECSNYNNIPTKKLPELLKYGYKTIR